MAAVTNLGDEMAGERGDWVVVGAGETVAPGVSRRRVLQGAVGAAVATIANRPGARGQDATPSAASLTRIVAYPQSGSRTAPPGTQLSFRGIALDEIGPVGVIGEQSGEHPGIWIAHSDGTGASFMPDGAFHPGEEVSVRTRLEFPGAEDGNFSFTVCRPKPIFADPERNETEDADQSHSFRSRPGLRPTVVTTERHSDGLADGLVFLAPKRATGRNGALIVDDRGEPVWFFPVELTIEEIYDFRAQLYRGEPVLTWWQGIVTGGHGYGHFVIRNAAYEEVASFRAGNGYLGADLHEFIITPRQTALILIYHTIGWDLTAMGGIAEGFAIDSIVQEIDIATGAVIAEWHCLDHVPLEEAQVVVSTENPEAPYDYFHINSVAEDDDGAWIVCARNTWASYKIDRGTGEVIWTLGGNASSFEMGEGTETAYQHDTRPWPDGEVTIFDNGGGPEVHEESRGLRIALDLDEGTATLLQAYVHPRAILATSQGNMQVLPNGNVFIGWGSEAEISEFAADGALLQDWIMPPDKQSYRAYRFPWVGLPAEPPAIAAEPGEGGEIAIFVSWNGATEVAEWRALAGPGPDDLDEAVISPRTGFETELTVTTGASHVAVEALAADGEVLGRSEVLEVTAA